MEKSKLMGIAKGKEKKVEKPTNTKKPTVKKEVEKPKTPAEERDIKAKQKVQELLKDVDLTLDKSTETGDELLEVNETERPVDVSLEWLEEQITSLNEVNEGLRIEIAQVKEDYRRIFDENQRIKNGAGITMNNDDSALKQTVSKLFNEIQTNYLAMGKDVNGFPNLVLPPVAFMNRLIMFFPFLQNEKRY
jgi:hypothetical protein